MNSSATFFLSPAIILPLNVFFEVMCFILLSSAMLKEITDFIRGGIELTPAELIYFSVIALALFIIILLIAFIFKKRKKCVLAIIILR